MKSLPQNVTHVHVCLVIQSCPNLCDPIDNSLPGSSVHGISQTRILEWFAISYSRGSSWRKDWSCFSLHGQEDSLPLSHLGSPTWEAPPHIRCLISVSCCYSTITAYCYLEKAMATHSSTLAWRIPGMAEPGGLPSMGSHRVRQDWYDLAAAAAAAYCYHHLSTR